jgi:phosphatidylglycerophosphate synthase
MDKIKKQVKQVKDQVKLEVKEESTIANWITIGRTIAVIVGLFFLKDHPVYLAILIVVAIALDGADGYAARKYRSSKRGALIDIFGDRIVEITILFAYAYWGLISYVFPVIFLVRGMTTDFIRVLNTMYPSEKYKHPLALGGAINRFMRGFYAILKASAFVTILLAPEVGFWLMVFAVVINLYRGIPAIFNHRAKTLLKTFFKRMTTPVKDR